MNKISYNETGQINQEESDKVLVHEIFYESSIKMHGVGHGAAMCSEFRKIAWFWSFNTLDLFWTPTVILTRRGSIDQKSSDVSLTFIFELNLKAYFYKFDSHLVGFWQICDFGRKIQWAGKCEKKK